MLVVCNSTSGNDVPEEQRFPAESRDADYSPLLIGKEYFVYSMIFYANRTDYLISHEGSPPIWVPSCLFSISNPRIDSGFYIAVIEGCGQFAWLHDNYGARFIIGYKKITESVDHFIGIIERNEADLIMFFEQKSLLSN